EDGGTLVGYRDIAEVWVPQLKRQLVPERKSLAEAGPGVLGTLRKEGLWASAARTITSAGIGFRNKKPRRVTGLSVMVGHRDTQSTPHPVHVRGPARPNWGGDTSRVCPFHNTDNKRLLEERMSGSCKSGGF